MVAAGITLQSENRYLDLVGPLAATADYVEVAPETLWRSGDGGELEPNGFHRALADFVGSTGRRVVAHGTGLSLGTADSADRPRLQRWLDRIEADHALFDFAWYTDHLGMSMAGEVVLALPVALPFTAAAAEVVRERLAALQQVVPDVGFENTVHYFLLGDWLDEPAFFADVLRAPRQHLLLDLHNVHTMAVNLGVDAETYLARLDLGRVIEIHVSGGRRSDPAWLPAGRTLWLDSHDAAVPEAVWRLCERIVPRCPNLRGLCLERMEGTLEERDIAAFAAELERLREIADGRA